MTRFRKASNTQDRNDEPAIAHFNRMRRAFRAAVAVTILVPCAYLAILGYQDWQDRMQAARETTEHATRVAEEHALKVFDINAALTDRVRESLRRYPREDAQPLHVTLQRLVYGYQQVVAFSVFDASGQLTASSLWDKVPRISIADREDFIQTRANAPRLYISGPMISRVNKRPTFNVSQAVSGADGTFDGLVSVAMSPAYFEDFYRQLVDSDPMTIGLIRGDGSILAWYPSPAGRPARISQNTPFFRDIKAGKKEAILTMGSTVDGQEKILAFRRVGEYDAYVTVGYPVRYVWAAWRARFTSLAIATAVPSLAFCLLILFSLRRLGHEQDLWQRARDESSMRESLEAAARENQHLESLGNLVALVAHDFNNLLMAIVGYAYSVEKGSPGLADRAVSGILQAAQRGQLLTRRLLSVARKQPMRPETFNFSQWSGVGLLRSAVGEAVVMDISIAPDLWSIRVDQAEFDLALLNISINAREAMGGQGRLNVIATNCSQHSVAGSSAGDFVRIQLCDTGIGIDADTMDRAFEPFFTTKPPGEGTGLGLAQVRSFCDLSGGLCSIAASPVGGTVVTLLLPRADDESAVTTSAETAKDRDDRRDEPITILLVEDDAIVADAQAAMLLSFGYEVTHAWNADEASRLLTPPHSFQAVLSDVHMPGERNGIDLAEQLLETQPDLPLMLVTGFVEHAGRLRELGIASSLKPVDGHELDQWIRRSVRLRYASSSHPVTGSNR